MSSTPRDSRERLRWGEVWVLYQHELRSALREKTIVLNSILIPILLYPFLLWAAFTGISYVAGRTEGFVRRVAVFHWPEEHPRLRLKLEYDNRYSVVEVTDVSTATNLLRAGMLDAVLEFEPARGPAAALPGNFSARISSDGLQERSREARDKLQAFVDQYRHDWLRREAKRLGIDAPGWQVFTIARENTATRKQMGAFLLGLVAPVLFVVMVAVGCFYPAVDCTAGERERGTWETLMTTAASRISMVTAKYLYVTTVGGMAGMLNLVTIALTLKPMFAPLLARTGKTLESGIPFSALPLALAGALLLAGFIAAGMMLFAAFARTFKEGQAMITPFYMLILVPIVFLQAPGMKLTMPLASVPIVNVTLMVREALSGTYHWPQIGVVLVSSLVVIALAVRLATSLLKVEDLMVGSYNGSLLKFLGTRLRRAPRPQTKS